MRAYAGYTYFPTGGPGGRHAMVTGVVNGQHTVFDPNFGMFRMRAVEFATRIANHPQEAYPRMLDDYAVYRVP